MLPKLLTEEIFRAIMVYYERMFFSGRRIGMQNGENDFAELTKKLAKLSAELEMKSPGTPPPPEAVEEIRRISIEIEATVARNSDSFWDLGTPRPRAYEKPDFSDRTVDSTEITDGEDAPCGEPIPPRSSMAPSSRGRSHTVKKTLNGTRIVTDSYRNRSARSARTRLEATQSSSLPSTASEIIASYSPDGPLILRIDVRTRGGGTEFYGKFAVNARKSHFDRAERGITPDDPAVPYFSYVPQYSHMSLAQIEFYKKLRESILAGEFPACDLAYVLLYIYEIINLPDLIPPSSGAELLAKIWLGYRRMHPRLDGYLCEWLPDYCMIHACSLPESIVKIMPELVPKAQFKEFYLNTAPGSPKSSAKHIDESDRAFVMAKSLVELLSDYDFHSSRYYAEHKNDYDTKLPAALSWVICDAWAKKRGIFSLERIYKMTRDSYTGAVVSSGIKRLLDIEFCSFTRRADARAEITALVKYAENRLRAALGIKAKLGVTAISPEDAAAIDRFFAPLVQAPVKRAAEDLYMPENYMKNYESEDSGFNFGTAAEIEARSWSNTALLTGGGAEEYTFADDSVTIEGQLSSDAEILTKPEDNGTEASDHATAEQTSEASESKTDGQADTQLRAGLCAALSGSFREYCRENALHEGELADRINTVFLDIIGDIVLEDGARGFELIEDYREDVVNWIE